MIWRQIVDIAAAHECAEVLKALAHPTRLQIVAELAKGTKCVTDIRDILPASQANISQHLTVLRHAKLVNFTQDGSQRCYYLCRPNLVKKMLVLLSEDETALRKDGHIGRGKKPSRAACGVSCG